jgi:hypothetical protein
MEEGRPGEKEGRLDDIAGVLYRLGLAVGDDGCMPVMDVSLAFVFAITIQRDTVTATRGQEVRPDSRSCNPFAAQADVCDMTH